MESLESRCLLSPLLKGGNNEHPAEVSSAKSFPKNGYPIVNLVGSWNIRYSFGPSRNLEFDGTMTLTQGQDEKSYVAHFVVPGQFDCVLTGKAKFGQPTGFSGKSVDAESDVKIKFKTHLDSMFAFSGTVKVGKQRGAIEGTHIGEP